MREYRSRSPQGKVPTRWAQSAAALVVAVSLLLPSVQPAVAQEPAVAPDVSKAALQVANLGAGVDIRWSGESAVVASAAAAGGGLLEALAAQMPFQRYQGYDLPFKVIPLRFAGPDAVVLPQITRLETVDLPAGTVVPGAPELPPVILDEGQESPAAQGVVALPDQPVFILRQGIVKGEYLVMVAVSPIFAQGGVTKLATVLETNVQGANAILETPWEYGEARASALAAADAAQPTSEPAVEAAEADAACATVTLVVARAGIQQIKAGALGANCTAASLASLRLTNRGVVVPVQVVGDELRFYVESVGDRWNVNSYLQASVEGDPARRSPAVGARTVTAPAAGTVSTVADRGEWKNQFHSPSTYGSHFPGADGDHYFSALFSTKAKTDTPPSVTAGLFNNANVLPPNQLPLVAGSGTYTFTVTPDLDNSAGSDYLLRLTQNGGFSDGTHQDLSFNGVAGVNRVVMSGPNNPLTMTVTFVPQDTLRTLWFESIAFSRAVELKLNGRGALFTGYLTDTQYRWQNPPLTASAYVVWDVTNPAAPVALAGASAAGFADSQPGLRYIVAGPDFINTPTVRAFKPLYAKSVPAAHAIYVIPGAEYAAPLQPLLTLRNQQGYKTATADVTRIYDGYSGGYIDSRAIRNFLKEAFTNWKNPQPISVVLVGDGTYDPKKFELNANLTPKERAPMLIPPYMEEDIDPWLGEAACDNCYGQLSGDASSANSALFAMDLMVGRFPVKTVDELSAVVNKIVSYETATDLKAAWRSTALYLADNYLKPPVDNPKSEYPCTPLFCRDMAGDFAAYSDGVRALNPNKGNANLTPRVYFDPFPAFQTPSAVSDWWRVPVREDAQQRALAGMQSGPAIVVYNGHANVFNMGELEKIGGDRKFLLGLTDEYRFFNANQLFVQLSMTCMTSSFATPANSATTIDEAFFLWPRGGAVAVWGSSGQSVVTGHESLQDGFFGALFAKPGAAVRLGDLLDSGYLNLTMAASGNEDILRTFLLLGDPLTKVAYPHGANATYIPIVAK